MLEFIRTNVALLNQKKTQLNYMLLLILILAQNAVLGYSSYLGVGGEFKRFIERQCLVFVWTYTFQKKEVYIYGKEDTPCNQKLK